MAIVKAPLSEAVASPDTAEKIYFFTLVNSDLRSVPPAPSSTINKSASAKSAPMSVAPSISNAPISTLPAVDIVDNLLSAIEPAKIVFVTVPLSPLPTSVPEATGNTTTALLEAECGCA